MTNSIKANNTFESQITQIDFQPVEQESSFKKLPLDLVASIFNKMKYVETVKIAHVLARDYKELLPTDGVLDLSGAKHLTDQYFFNIIKKCKSKNKIIVSINLSKCSLITNDAFVHVASLEELRELKLSNCVQITVFSPLAALKQLTTLDLSHNTIRDLSTLVALKQLTTLDLSHGKHIIDLSPLVALKQLKTLYLAYCYQIKNLSPLRELLQLTSLDLTFNDYITDISSLAALEQLTTLNLTYFLHLADISPLGSLKQLRTLILSSCNQITDLSPLGELLQLVILDLSYCKNITDLSPLAPLVQLTTLILLNCPNIQNKSRF